MTRRVQPLTVRRGASPRPSRCALVLVAVAVAGVAGAGMTVRTPSASGADTTAVTDGVEARGPVDTDSARVPAAARWPAEAGSSSLARMDTRQAAKIPGMEVIAHRGGVSLAPENTLAAIAHAASVGADAVELDVVFTADDRIAVLHDLTLDRTTDCTGSVSARTWTELTRCDAGSWFDGRFRGERIPSLAAALDEAARHGMRTYVHVKHANTRAQARALVTTLEAHDPVGWNVIFSSDFAALDRLQAAGASRRDLGLLFTAAPGWTSRYGTVVPYRTAITRSLVETAHRHGSRVVAVQGHPVGVPDFRSVGLDGYMADTLGRVLPP